MTTTGELEPRRAALGGLVATFVALTAGYWVPAIGLPRLDFPLINGRILVPDLSAVSFAWSVGLVQTLALGAVASLVYGRWIRRHLPGAPWQQGMLWGAVLGVVSGLTLFPLLYGAGIFGLSWNPGAPVSLAIWFLSWGVTLGLATAD